MQCFTLAAASHSLEADAVTLKDLALREIVRAVVDMNTIA